MIGIDIVDIKKIKEKGEGFIHRIFTEKEATYALSKENTYQTLGGIFAAKEAVIKTYSLNLSYIVHKKIEILHTNRMPYVQINGKDTKCCLSISHDNDYAVAICLKKEANNEIALDNKTLNDFKELLPKREKASHKGTYGRLAILGGSDGMTGSIYLASSAALRTGSGLVYNIVPRSIYEIMQIKAVEQIILPLATYNIEYDEKNEKLLEEYLFDKDSLVIGPGMGKNKTLIYLIEKLISKFSGTILIDADGLNALSGNLDVIFKKENIILTPHLKEFERLSNIPIKEINKNRVDIAKDFARKNKVVLVLKSEETLVTDGYKIYINKLGNPGMATAGSGDVLSGVIGSLSSRLEPYDAARLGVYLHSLAGDLASVEVGEDSLIASDIVSHISSAIKYLR